MVAPQENRPGLRGLSGREVAGMRDCGKALDGGEVLIAGSKQIFVLEGAGGDP